MIHGTMARALALLLAATCLSAVASKSEDKADALQRPAAKFDPLLEPFVRSPSYISMQLSPDGRHVAAIVGNDENTGVAMFDGATRDWNLILQPKWWKVQGYLPYVRNPISVRWLDDKDIAVSFSIADGQAFDIDGKPGIDLMKGYVHVLRDAEGKPTDWHLVNRAVHPTRLSRLNLKTGKSEDYDLDVSGDLMDWLSDSRGDIRVARTSDTAFFSDHTKITTWYRKSVDADWVRIDERSILADSFRPVFIDKRPGHLIVQAHNGADRFAIWDFDVEKKTFGELLFGHDSEDIVAVTADASRRDFNSVVTTGLRRRTFWFDERHAALQEAIDQALPGRVNTLGVGADNSALVFTYSDVDPGRWFLLDESTHKMREIARRMPSIDPKRMQPMQTLHYPAPDGLSIPAYLTLPGKPTGPAPTVVLIHGGPQARDHWEFDPDVQILAAHGYAVFQPQFRGSTGFGKKFEEAGYGQWGLGMQDDISAGVRWLVDQKIADPDRICIMGSSYGGYAALWGLEKTPELYKCGISFAGVTDLKRMLHDDSDISKDAMLREEVRYILGDADKIDFDAVSPVRHADRIRAPVLLVHGGLDRRVPISHGEKMRDALKALNKDVEWVDFPEESHGISGTENRRVYYGAVFGLLARTIGKGVPPLAPPLPTADEITLTPADALVHP